MAILSVKIGEVTFKLPFSDLVPFSEADEKDLEESIREAGRVTVPVICWKEKRKINEEETVIDGAHRLLICARLGMKCPPLQYVSFESEEEARAKCEELNYSRRHCKPDEIQAHRAARIKRIAAARGQEGQSIRAIAKEEEISEAQVRRDLEASTAPGGGAVEPPDGKVTGLDGRQQTATPAKTPSILCAGCKRAERVGTERPKKCAACKELREADKKAKKEECEKKARDKEAASQKEESVEETRKRINNEIETFCRDIMAKVEETLPRDVWISHDNKREGVQRKFRDACEMLRTCKCTGECKRCKGTKLDEGKKCVPCKGTGRLPKLNAEML